MSDPAKLREALDDFVRRLGMGKGFGLSAKQPPTSVVLAAARDYLALLESDAIVIRRDAEGNWPEDVVKAVGEGWWTAHVASNKRLAGWIILDALADVFKAEKGD